MQTVTSPRTAARRAGKARATHLAPFRAMTDKELVRAYRRAENHGDRQAAYSVIVERIDARGIVVDYDRADDATESAVLAFEAVA